MPGTQKKGWSVCGCPPQIHSTPLKRDRQARASEGVGFEIAVGQQLGNDCGIC